MPQQLEELVCRYLDGRADAEEVRRLDQAVQSDRQVARMLVEMAALESQLGQMMSLDHTAAEISTDQPTVAAAAESPLAARTKQARKQQRRWRIIGVATAVAACAAVVMLMVYNAVRPAPSPSPTDSPLVATVMEINGTAERFPGGTGESVQLSQGDLVQVGDALRVGGGSETQLKLQYPDETTVEFFERATATLMGSNGAKRVQLDTGRLFADVSVQPAGREMTFATADAEAKVLGTQLRLTAMPNATVLEVAEGKVEFTRLADLETQLVSAQQHAVSRVDIPLIPQTVPWPSGQIFLPPDIVRPGGVAHDGQNLWVSNGGIVGPVIPKGSHRGQLIFKVSPFDGGIDHTATLDLTSILGENGLAGGLAWDGQSLWVTDQVGYRVLCIDPASGTVQKQFSTRYEVVEGTRISRRIKDVAIGGGFLWCLGRGSISDGQTGTVIYKMNLNDGGEIARFPAPAGFTFYAITFHEGDLLLHGVGPDAAGRIFRLNPVDGETKQKYLGAKAATAVTGICSDPTGQLWLLSAGVLDSEGFHESAGERWLRPIDSADLQEF